MTAQDISKAIADAINAIQQASGNPLLPVLPESKPIGDLPGFDSLLGLEVTLELEKVVGHLPWQNVFVNDEQTKALTVSEVVSRIASLESHKP